MPFISDVEMIKRLLSFFISELGYEVHIKRIRTARIIAGQFFNSSIRLATEEEFGKWEWSFIDYWKAYKKFHDILGQYKVGGKIEDFKYEPKDSDEQCQ